MSRKQSGKEWERSSVVERLILVGASVRAAAFAAQRAGWQPWCLDLFGDADLAARAPVQRVPARDYPQGLEQLLDQAPPGPWLYTGALENWPELLERLNQKRPLWGMSGPVLRQVRDPFFLFPWLERHLGLRCPQVRKLPAAALPSGGCWLLKPRRSGGGHGIRFWSPTCQHLSPADYYLQEYLPGTSWSALYGSDGRQVQLLGVTRQLVGETWLHARPFHYCGSVGPWTFSSGQQALLERLGEGLAALGVRGLFGVDLVLSDGMLVPLEVNPRYVASAEVLELAQGQPLLAWQRRAFEGAAPAAPPGRAPQTGLLGKAILFAPRPAVFPAAGPWQAFCTGSADPWQLPAFADVPVAGSLLRPGRPVLTFFARGASLDDCLEQLRQQAAALSQELFPDTSC
jgi:predicted ATP-grasp superfamily ATP-dependent carboligase